MSMTKLAAIIVLGSGLSVSNAQANTRGFDLELGPFVSYLDYSEQPNTDQYGILIGAKARYASYYNFSVLLLDLRYASDKVTQKGAGKIEEAKNQLFDVRSMIGRALYLGDRYRITPYLGLGYRRSTLDSRDRISTTSVAGYKSQQTYLYNPIGLEFQALTTDNGWLLGGRVEYDTILVARSDTRLSAAEGYQAVETGLSKGRGYHFSLKFKRQVGQEGSGFVIEPFYTYWLAKDANKTGLTEPFADHTSNEWGVSLLVAF